MCHIFIPSLLRRSLNHQCRRYYLLHPSRKRLRRRLYLLFHCFQPMCLMRLLRRRPNLLRR
jgi:hypothetical protein